MHRLDLKGLKCPLPALFTRRALRKASPGDCYIVECDDPLATLDIPHMCRTEGYEVVAVTREGESSRITVRRPDINAEPECASRPDGQ